MTGFLSENTFLFVADPVESPESAHLEKQALGEYTFCFRWWHWEIDDPASICEPGDCVQGRLGSMGVAGQFGMYKMHLYPHRRLEDVKAWR